MVDIGLSRILLSFVCTSLKSGMKISVNSHLLHIAVRPYPKKNAAKYQLMGTGVRSRGGGWGAIASPEGGHTPKMLTHISNT